MAEIQKINATLVDKTHSWSDRASGEMKFKFRLDDSRLLVLKCGMGMYDHHFEQEDNPNTLRKLYNDSASVGARVSLSLAFDEKRQPAYMGFERISEPAPKDAAHSTWQALPLIGRLTGQRLVCKV